jgi:protein TonB
MPSPCRSIEVEIESIADQQGAMLAQEKSAFVKGKPNFGVCKFPDYPRMSLKNEESGTVRLMFLTDADGSVERVLNRKSSGSPLLDSAALEAMKLCRFRPATLNEVPERSWVTVDYVFKLPD